VILGKHCLFFADDPFEKDYSADDDLLKEILMKLYYNNYKGFQQKKTGSLKEEIKSRKLFRSILYGDYTPQGVMYAVEGSPPKGRILILDYEAGDPIYFYHGKMHSLNSQKYIWACKLFREDAKKYLKNKTNEPVT